MNEKEFMKQVSAAAMPDFTGVKESCLEMLNEDRKKEQKTLRFAGVVAMAALLVSLFIIPENSLAQGIVKYVKTMLNLNGTTVNLGDRDDISIKVPDDCEKVNDDGVTFLTKSYNSVDALTKDIGVNIYTWGRGNLADDGILLNAVENDYGWIALLYDVAEDNSLDEEEDKNVLQSVTMFIYFALSKDTTFGDLMLKSEQMAYGTIDDEGNIEEYRQNTEFDLVGQYESKALNTTVTVISSKVDTKASGDLGEFVDLNANYYLYFTLEGMCYRVNCVGPLDKAQEVVENIISEGKEKNIQSSSMEKELDTNDLLYLDTAGDSISLERGENVKILVENGKEYQDVTVLLLGKDNIQEIGQLNISTPYSFIVEVSGEYAIYAGTENITNAVVLERSQNTAVGDVFPVN